LKTLSELAYDDGTSNFKAPADTAEETDSEAYSLKWVDNGTDTAKLARTLSNELPLKMFCGSQNLLEMEQRFNDRFQYAKPSEEIVRWSCL
jgi:hypothetical protein